MTSFKLNQAALDKVFNEAAQRTEKVLNEAMGQVQGQPLDQATDAVCAKLKAAGIDPNRKEIRGLLLKHGWTS